MQRTPIQTRDEALSLLRRVVDAAGPEYIDPRSITKGVSCRYVVDGAPACIVGRALALAGWDVEALVVLDTHGDELGISADELHSHYTEVSSEAARVFQAAQMEQDFGSTWGSAFMAADAS